MITPDEEHLLKDTWIGTLRRHPDRLRSAVQKSAPASATQACGMRVRKPEWTGMRAAAAGVPALNRYREPRVWWRHGSHGAARREVQAGAR